MQPLPLLAWSLLDLVWPAHAASPTATSRVPPALYGVWGACNVSVTPLGPQDLNRSPLLEFMVVSEPGDQGDVYIRHTRESQLYRIQGNLAQYCFDYQQSGYNNPVTGSDEAPFFVARSDSTSIRFCWRGPRLPSHRLGCTGCGCAQWDIVVTGDRVVSTFLQSPPAIHMQVELWRMGAAPLQPATVRAGWDCRFDNYTGFPNHSAAVTAPVRSSCPLSRPTAAVTPAPNSHLTAKQDTLANCLLINSIHNVRLEYVASKLPCSPCDVTFNLSAHTPDPRSYLAIGFKERYAAYYGFDKLGDVPGYFGMSASSTVNQTGLSGRILVGYMGQHTGCIRTMVADEYVGSVKDVPDDGLVFDKVVSRRNDRTSLQFTASIHAGEDADELAWFNRGFGDQRIMWAIGSYAGDGNCEAATKIGYHQGVRGLASLNFPGFGNPCQ